MRALDWPPVWLVLFMAMAWLLAMMIPGWTIQFPGQVWVSIAVAGLGIIVMLLAVAQMLGARTTVIPRRQPNHLVKSGVFSITRNPIYLGDALVLTGFVLWLGAVAAVPLIVAFVFLITRRFILSEEAWIQSVFGDEFDDWAKKTRRWL